MQVDTGLSTDRSWLPGPDRVRSPQTGWVRTHWLAVADHLLQALPPWTSPLGARIDLPGRPSRSGRDSDALEGFARSFLLAACRIAATNGEGCEDLVDRYARGVVAGSDPDSAEAWPRLTPCSQQLVEASAVAIALHESRRWIWDRLDEREQRLVAEWIGGFAGSRTWDSNWRLFQVVGEQFLASVGAPYRADDIEAGLDRIEDWYRGEGWYTDGDGQKFDYYANFVMHPFPALWTRMAAATPGADPTARLETYRTRLRSFLQDAAYFLGPDGAPVHQGRSLTYRFGVLAPFWAGQLLDASPLTPGQTRRLCSGTLRHFLEHGVPDSRGLLSLGWYDQHLPTTQVYSGPGSPYWGSLGFLGLLLGEDHPVWADPEEVLPQDRADLVRPMPVPGFLVHATRHDNLVRLLNHGSDHLPDPVDGQPEPAGDPHYDRLAFSSHTGPDLPLGDDTRQVDNCLTLIGPDGTESRRGHIRRLGIGERCAASWHRAELPGVAGGPWRVETASVVHGGWEVRVCLVEGTAALTVRMGGYALADTAQPQVRVEASRPWAWASRPDGLTSTVVGLHGFTDSGIQRRVGANAFGPHSATPYLTARHTGEPLVLVSAVVLTGDTLTPGTVAEAIKVTVSGHRVRLALADGEEFTVSLGEDVTGPRCTRARDPYAVAAENEVGDG